MDFDETLNEMFTMLQGTDNLKDLLLQDGAIFNTGE